MGLWLPLDYPARRTAARDRWHRCDPVAVHGPVAAAVPIEKPPMALQHLLTHPQDTRFHCLSGIRVQRFSRSFPSLLRTAKRQAHNLWKTGRMRAMHQRLGSQGVSDRRHLH